MCARHQQLTAVVGVCDEIELIEHCLAHLERQGVNSIVVVDMLSRDGTRELLRQWKVAGRIALIERSNDSNLDADYLGAGVEYARKHWDPKWILLQDADEFCLAATMDLSHSMVKRASGIYKIPRYNACLSPRLLSAFAGRGAVSIEAINVWAAPRSLSRDAMDQDPTVRWSSAQPAPKIVAATELIAAVGPGGHAVLDGDGKAVPMTIAADLLVVHIPFLSFARFAKKIARAKDLIANDRSYFRGATGWHWRRWIEILNAGTLEEEYRRQYLDEGDLVREIETGSVQRADAMLVDRIY